MPYTIRKQKCKQSTGKKGSYVLSYKDNKGKKHRACHTSRKKARGQIAAIEAESVERDQPMKITLSEIRTLIRHVLNEAAYISSLDQVLGQNNVNNYLRMLNDPKNVKDIAKIVKSSLQSNLPAPNLMTHFKELEGLNLQDPELDPKYIKDVLTKLLTSENQEAERELSASEKEEKIKKYIAGYKDPKIDSNDIDVYMRDFGKPVRTESLEKLKILIRKLVLELKK